MNITVNDNPQQVTDDCSIAQLLDKLELNPDTVVVELDKTIIKRQDFNTTPLQEGSKVELIRFVGGG